MDVAKELQRLYRQERERLLSLPESAPSGDYQNPVFGEGPIHPKLMLLGEAPGKDEARLGRAFVGKAGQQLDELLSAAGILRQEVFVTNTVRYRPMKIGERSVSNRTPLKGEIEESLPVLRREIELVKPRVIATLGNTPLSAICMLSGQGKKTVGEVHGTPFAVKVGDCSMTLVSLYHPASVIYNPKLKQVLYDDMKQLKCLLEEVCCL